VSRLAASGDARANPDYRNNPSLLIGHRGSHAVVDAGKTFRESLTRFLPGLAIPRIDAIVLTHEHMDAFGGLDDVRGMQMPSADGSPLPMPIFLSPKTLKVVESTFPYLVPAPPPPLQAGSVREKRHVASLSFLPLAPFRPFALPALPGERPLEVTPLPVVHGEDCTCLGFAFGEQDAVLYLSDISRLPPETRAWIKDWIKGLEARGGRLAVLVVDALRESGSHNTHFCLPQAAALIRELRPGRALLVGMGCDAFPPHEEMNEKLEGMFRGEGIEVRLARDGQRIELNL
jgi:phosphoribosyl 1,2-cyclic phosphodiesterase